MRSRITQEYMATMLGRESRGEAVNHPALKHFHNALYSSIVSYVYSIAKRYVFTTGIETGELMVILYSKIIEVMHKYEYKRGKFSHWVWHVGVNKLNKLYNKNRKRTDKEILVEEFDLFEASRKDDALVKSIIDAIDELKGIYPNKTNVIDGLFSGYGRSEVSDRIDFVKAVEVSGMSMSGVRAFYGKKIKPHMMERLSDYVL